MVIYESESHYIESATSIEAKIQRLDTIILSLYDVLIKAALKDYIEGYEMDDGQTRIKTTYRGAESVQKSINALEFAKQRLITLLNKNKTGSVVRLTDSRNLIGGNGRNNR